MSYGGEEEEICLSHQGRESGEGEDDGRIGGTERTELEDGFGCAREVRVFEPEAGNEADGELRDHFREFGGEGDEDGHQVELAGDGAFDGEGPPAEKNGA